MPSPTPTPSETAPTSTPVSPALSRPFPATKPIWAAAVLPSTPRLSPAAPKPIPAPATAAPPPTMSFPVPSHTLERAERVVLDCAHAQRWQVQKRRAGGAVCPVARQWPVWLVRSLRRCVGQSAHDAGDLTDVPPSSVTRVAPVVSRLQAARGGGVRARQLCARAAAESCRCRRIDSCPHIAMHVGGYIPPTRDRTAIHRTHAGATIAWPRMAAVTLSPDAYAEMIFRVGRPSATTQRSVWRDQESAGYSCSSCESHAAKAPLRIESARTSPTWPNPSVSAGAIATATGRVATNGMMVGL
eukprot:scaffold3499_cov117-Isochrysis_galbana.AAC.13